MASGGLARPERLGALSRSFSCLSRASSLRSLSSLADGGGRGGATPLGYEAAGRGAVASRRLGTRDAQHNPGLVGGCDGRRGRGEALEVE